MSTAKPKKTFPLRMRTTPEVELFTKFQKIVTYQRETARETLLEFVREYVKANTPRDENGKPIKLASETEVLEAAKKANLDTNKALLIKHRIQGNIDGFWRSNDDGRIVYELEPVIKFLKGRRGKGSGGWLNRADAEQGA